jgi:hypothetical protein
LAKAPTVTGVAVTVPYPELEKYAQPTELDFNVVT